MSLENRDRWGTRFYVNGETYDYYPKKMLNVEAMAIEEKTGYTLTALGNAIRAGSAKAQTAVIWVMMKRVTPTLRFTDVTFEVGSVDIDILCPDRHIVQPMKDEEGKQFIPHWCLECGEEENSGKDSPGDEGKEPTDT